MIVFNCLSLIWPILYTKKKNVFYWCIEKDDFFQRKAGDKLSRFSTILMERFRDFLVFFKINFILRTKSM